MLDRGRDVVAAVTASFGITPEGRALRDRAIVKLKLDQPDLTYKDIARSIGVGPTTVSATLKRHANKLAQAVAVPGWVPEHLHGAYRMIAVLDGEEDAASYCRRAKRDPVASLGPCEHGAR